MVVRKRQIEKKKKKKKSTNSLSHKRIKLRLEFVSFLILVTIVRKSFELGMRMIIFIKS